MPLYRIGHRHRRAPMVVMMLLLTLLGSPAAAAAQAPVSAVAPSFTIAHDQFVQDGKVTHLRAGCIHYSVRSRRR